MGQFGRFPGVPGTHHWKGHPKTHPPRDVILVQSREFQVKKPGDVCSQELFGVDVSRAGTDLGQVSARGTLETEICFICTFATGMETLCVTSNERYSQHSEKMLLCAAVMYISFRKSHLDCVRTLSQVLIVIYCKSMVALISSGITSLTPAFFLLALLTVILSRGPY